MDANDKNEVETPDHFWAALDAEFNFGFDLAASRENAKIKQAYFSKRDDALAQDWLYLQKQLDDDQFLWLNPPYAAGQVGRFMEKVAEENERGCRIVTLTRFDYSNWFLESVWGVAAEVRLIPRIKFKHHDFSYPFPLCVSVFKGWPAGIAPTSFRPWDYRLA